MSEFEKALKKYADFVVKKSQQNLSKGGKFGSYNKSGALSKSLDYKINKGKVTFRGLKYGEYLDQGVKGAKSTYPESSTSPFRYRNLRPPASVFDKWTIKSSIAPRDKKGRFLKRKSLNYIIANSIFKKGIRATMFFTKPFERGLEIYGDEIVAAYLEDNLKT
tara:strand:- start:675 stop:1163 length:489 start_codon:yes stop_codon:yes gene_type:complete